MSLRSGLALFVAMVTATSVTAAAPPPAGAVVAAPEPAVARDGGAGLTWGECPPAKAGVRRDPRQRCARLRVPLDYRAPRGRTIEITVSRIGTARPESRRGILVSNPGGPGDGGLDLPSRLADTLPPEVLDQYDLIGFDPRGVGHSTPVTCGLDLPRITTLRFPYPAPDGGIQRNVDFARDTAAACARHSGDLLPFITTANTARDIDRLRAALGEPKLSYFGVSYGTYLGTVYDFLFPGRTDRIVLDSAVDPARVWRDHWLLWGQATAERLSDLLTFIAERDDLYHLGATPQEVRRTFDRLTTNLDRRPLPTPDGPYDGNSLRSVTRFMLYGDEGFPTLAEIWQILADTIPASTVDTAILTRLAAIGRAPIGRAVGGGGAGPAGIPADNGTAAMYAVVCGDAAWPRSEELYARQVAADRRTWPVTAGMPANIWPCAAWPTPPIEPPITVTGHGPRNVLILQNTRDPATPLTGARGLRAAFGPRAAMITVDRGGHGAAGLGGCADAAMTSFLATGTLPARDRSCPAPAPADAPSAASPYTTSAGPL